MGENGHIYLLQESVLTEGQFYLVEWSEEKGYVSEKLPTGILTKELCAEIRSFYVREDGNIYLLTSNGIKILNSDFAEEKCRCHRESFIR